MEDEGLLVPDNELDIYCLHICFFHLIQQDLDTFREAWNLHKIRTANNMSPQQLFIAGLDNLARYAAEKGMIFTEPIQVSLVTTKINISPFPSLLLNDM